MGILLRSFGEEVLHFCDDWSYTIQLTTIHVERKIMKRKIIVFSGKQRQQDKPPKKLLRFNEWLQNKIQEIPVDHQGVATIDAVIKSHDGSNSYAAIEIAYQREETDDDKRNIQKELAELKRLKAKYDA